MIYVMNCVIQLLLLLLRTVECVIFVVKCLHSVSRIVITLLNEISKSIYIHQSYTMHISLSK